MPTKHQPDRTSATPLKKVAVPINLSWVAKKDNVRTGPLIVDTPIKNKICEEKREEKWLGVFKVTVVYESEYIGKWFFFTTARTGIRKHL